MHAGEVAGLVVARAELAAPQIGEQRIVVVGFALGAQLGFGTRRLLLGLGRDGLGCRRARALAACQAGAVCTLASVSARIASTAAKRLLHRRGGGVALRLRARHLLQQRLAALGGGGDAQAIVVQDLHGAALAGIEIADEPAGCHLVELDARQLPQRLAALLAQPLGLADGRAQRGVELAFLAMRRLAMALSIDASVCRPVHMQRVPTTS